MSKATEIINRYTNGELTLEEANAALAECSTLQLNPEKNVITEEEKAATVVSDDPMQVTGWGLMNHGIGSPEKMYVENGKFAYDTGFGLGEHDPSAVLYIGGRVYHIEADHLAHELV